MTTFQRDGSNETGCACHWTEAGIRAEVARETREQVAREIEAYRSGNLITGWLTVQHAAAIARGER